MSALEKSMSRRRRAAQSADRRKKLLLIGLTGVFALLLAIQGPKLLKGSGSSSASSSTSIPTTATSAPSADGTRSLAVSSTSVGARRMRAIRGMAAKDLFVPLVHDGSSTSSSATASPSAPAPASAPAPVAQPAAPAASVASKPAHVKPAAPNAAVIWTNGQRQVVGMSQVFKVGDTQFRLVGVTRDSMRIKVLGGAFSGRGAAITVRKGHRVRLANTATGVQYGLLFTQAGIAAGSNSN